jgi:hypothetical protein
MSLAALAPVQVLPIEPAGYQPHVLHAEDRAWPEVNCYVDLWVELLHSLGLDPVPGLAFALSSGFEVDQWRFLKYPSEDLRTLYGIDVIELNPWRGTERIIVDHLAMGHLLTVEVDAWFLPDTAGTSYRRQHVKTTIAPNRIDPDRRHLGYFHADGYYQLSSDDYVGALATGPQAEDRLPPYIERIRLDAAAPLVGDELTAAALALARSHLGCAPATHPVQLMRHQLDHERGWLAEGGIDRFHDCAFATLRQCGAGADLAADLCGWLAARGVPVAGAVDPWHQLALAAKSAQFALARVSARGTGSVDGPLEQMERWWSAATAAMAGIRGR